MRRSLSIIVVLGLLGAVAPVGAQSELDQARAERQALQAQAAATAGQIDVLEAEDADIVAALADVDGWINAQEALLASAERDLTATLATEADERVRADELALDIEELNAQLTDQLVTGYIDGFRNEDSLILSTDDINSVPMLKFVLRESAGVSADTTDRLRSAQDQQRDAIEGAEQAAAEALGIRDDIAVRLGQLEVTRSTQEQLRSEVNRRIADLEDEASALAAADAEVEQFIRAEVARLAAEEAARVEAARLEAARVEAARLEAERVEAQRIAAEEAEADRVEAERVAAEEAVTEDEVPESEDDGSEPTTEPAPQPDPAPTDAPTFIRPVPGRVNSPFGFRIHPVFGTRRMHTGIDYQGSRGDPVAASAGGTVIFSGVFGAYGNAVIIQHSAGYTTLYAHMDSVNVSNGAAINAGDTVGFVGSTGRSTGPHLHFEVRLNGTAVDPAPLY